jgi:hypothetical protein
VWLTLLCGVSLVANLCLPLCLHLHLYLQHAEYELWDEMCVCAYYVDRALEQVSSQQGFRDSGRLGLAWSNIILSDVQQVQIAIH